MWAGHPWVYAQAIDRVEGGATAGDEVSVVDPRGNLLGRGFYSPGSAIPVRLLVRDEKTRLDASFFHARHRASGGAAGVARAARATQTSGFRLVHAEGDGLPGLIVDRFGDVLAVQLGTIGMKQREALVLEALWTHARAARDRRPHAARRPRRRRGSSRLAASSAASDGARARVRGARACAFHFPLELGQKTGFYFDQRPLRARVEQLARGQARPRRVLASSARSRWRRRAAARARSWPWTRARSPSRSARSARAANGLGRSHRVREGRRAARRSRRPRATYDLVIVDPPRLAPTRGARDQALVAYAKLAENACRAVRPAGSSSAARARPRSICTRSRARSPGRDARQRRGHRPRAWFQGADHPVPAAFGEGLYLKALIARSRAARRAVTPL